MKTSYVEDLVLVLRGLHSNLGFKSKPQIKNKLKFGIKGQK